ncbi:hypothetical protein LWE61_11225 [Sphingobium sufflavum]|uniref:hypothetical protein n=1 Tax=Sphingobium sufflavum TaxID=1129547 RepID=UPI001F37EDEC|nr:hypothetical protein [Sphingobium sufflavum]MCE7797129.1 hypothetical protein [Sphingobium sufflavum]
MRRFCAMLSILLALLFAGVQGGNALDRLQHGLTQEGAEHVHEAPSLLTLAEAGSAQEAPHLDLSDVGERDDLPATPHHHHHNADHGSGLPSPHMAQVGAASPSSVRVAIPHARADIGSPAAALERPPKGLPAAA